MQGVLRARRECAKQTHDVAENALAWTLLLCLGVKSLLPLLVLLAACAPSIPQNPTPSVIVVQFDPGAAVPVVPTPNDLARDPSTGLVVVPKTPGETATQREFEDTYLQTLAGFPFESTALVTMNGDLDPTTVTAQSVLALDVANMTPVAIAPAYDQAARSISVTPTAGTWTRGHTYAVALVAGANGLRGAKGEPVVGSETWALVSSSTSLVTCTDLTAANCRPTVDVIPSSQTDPAARLADQTAKAIALEQLRRQYAPLLDGLAAQGLPRENVPIAWTFTIVDAGEATFDPAHGVIPFPNDLLRTGGKVNLPNPKTQAPLTSADCTAPTDPLLAITCGLNTLDGFSTLAPPVSENSDTLGAVAQASIDPASLSAASVGLLPVATQAPAGESTAPHFTPCLNCLSSTDSGGNPQTTPQQLQWKLDAPLDERTTYFAYVTSGVKDSTGKPVIANPIFAMLRLTNPLFDGTHTTINLLTDAQAAQLEPLRVAMKPALDGLGQAGIARSSLALAFGFTTVSEASVLDQLHAYPYGPISAVVPDSPLYVVDATAQYQARATAGSIPFSAIGKVYIGSFLTPVAITGPQGTLDVTNPQVEPVSFVLYLPAFPAPSAGYALTIFDHGLTRTRNDSIAIANALAQGGQATIAMDILFHGDRSSCTGSTAATMQASDDAACADPINQKCDENALIGRCIARDSSTRAACTGATGDLVCAAQGQGRCVTADQKCEGGDFLRDAKGVPVISGWNIFNLTNFFATRDNFRQHVIDSSELVRLVHGQGAGSLSTLAATSFDPTALGYLGENLGGALGSLAHAVSPYTTHVVFNASGGALVQLLLQSPAFAAKKTELLATLALLGLQPGTPAFDQFLGIAQWILDPADPANVGYRLTHSVSVTQNNVTYAAPNAGRAAFVQFIEGDQLVPNTSSFALVASANRSFVPTPPSFGCVAPLACYEFTETGDAFDATSAVPATRSMFLIQPPQGSRGLALTGKAQLQVATFLATGQVP